MASDAKTQSQVNGDEDDTYLNQHLLLWSEYQDRLDRYLIDYKNYLDLKQEQDLRPTFKDLQLSDKDELMQKIDQIRSEVLEVSSHNSLKDLEIEHVMLTTQYLSRIYPDQDGNVDEEFVQAITNLTELDSEVLKLSEKLEQMQNNTYEVRINIQDKVAIAKEKFAELEEKQSKALNQEQSHLAKELENQLNQSKALKQQITLNRHILQGLILESGKDWFNDRNLRELVKDVDMPELEL